MSGWAVLVALAAVWAAASAGTGAVLALIAKRMHPSLSFRRLWLFYALLMALLCALVLAVGWF